MTRHPFDDVLADMLHKGRPWAEIKAAVDEHLVRSGAIYAEQQRLAKAIGDKAPDAALTGRVQNYLVNLPD
jgi:hypothetical protein